MTVSVLFWFEEPITVLAMMDLVVAFGACVWNPVVSACRPRSNDDGFF